MSVMCNAIITQTISHLRDSFSPKTVLAFLWAAKHELLVQVVAPKRAALAEANKRLEGANKKLTGIRAKVKELKDRVASLEDSLMKVGSASRCGLASMTPRHGEILKQLPSTQSSLLEHLTHCAVAS